MNYLVRFFDRSVAFAWTAPMVWATPEVRVPYVSEPVKIDGTIVEAEWKDAATVTRLNELGDKKLADPASSFQLQYDDQALYIAARITETKDHVIHASEHGTLDDLSGEDAVQIVLGSADEFITKREVLNMGGYEGAMNSSVTEADHYYQFTVNAAGSMTRAYNETPVDRPLFKSAVRRVPTGWEVELAIPFASWGFDKPAGKTAFANFFRFRPPNMVAWSLPSFGGYSAMPMGRIKFLPKDAEKDSATTEKVEEPTPVADATSAPAYHADLSASVGYYPLSGMIVANVGLAEELKGATCLVESDGAQIGSWPIGDAPDQIFRAEIPKGAQKERTLGIKILAKDGRVLLEKANKFAAVPAPDWLGTSAGSDYLAKRVPSPWKTPEVSGNNVKLAQANLTLGKLGLFSGISDDLGNLLTGDSSVLIEQNGKPLKVGADSSKITLDGSVVTTESSAPVGSGRVEVRTRIDYDGFTEVKLRLRDIDLKTISRLTVALSMPATSARFVHQLLVQQIKPLTGVGYNFKGGPLWVGNQDKGIDFSYDVSPFLSKETTDRVQVVENGKTTKLEINLVNEKGELTEADHVFRFFLQPTPTRPRSLEQGFSKVIMTWEQWASRQGELQFDKIPEIRNWTDELSKQGLMGTVYTTQGLAADTDDFKNYKSDLEIDPSWLCYKRGYEPGQNVPVFAVCRRGPDGDRMLFGLKRFIDEANISGICDDGMSIAWECNNPSHPPGCGEAPVIGWDEKSESRILRQRDFLKRLRGIFDETGKPYFLSAHAGGGLDIATLSFFDGYMEGEQLARFRPGYHIPLGLFSIGYSGQPWGFRTRFWDKTWRRERGFYWSYAYVLLHAGDYQDSPEIYEITKDFRDDKTTTFYPYWRPGSGVNVQSDHSVYSYLKKADTALVTVGNMTFRNDDIIIDFGKLFPGKTIQVENVLAGGSIVPLIAGKKITRTLEPWKCATYRVNVVTGSGDQKAADFEQTGYEASSWSVTGSKNGVTSENVQDETGKDVAIRLGSTIWQDRAVIEWNAPGASDVISGKIKVQHTGRLTIQFGDGEITYDSGWQQTGFTGGHLFQAPVVSDRPVEIDFVIDHGRLDLSYNKCALAQGLHVDSTPSAIEFKTWAGDSLTLWPVVLSSKPSAVYEEAEGKTLVANLPNQDTIAATSYQPDQWRVTQPAPESGQAKPAAGDELVLRSSKDQPSIATFAAGTFGDDATISLLVTPSGRMDVSVGGVGIAFNWSWELNGQPAGWNEGRLYPVDLNRNKPELLVISIADGKWTVTYAGKLLAKDMEFAAYQKSGNVLQIKTWAGDSLTLKVNNIRSEATPLVNDATHHPVL